jgi:hypothetical protein
MININLGIKWTDSRHVESLAAVTFDLNLIQGFHLVADQYNCSKFNPQILKINVSVRCEVLMLR